MRNSPKKSPTKSLKPFHIFLSTNSPFELYKHNFYYTFVKNPRIREINGNL